MERVQLDLREVLFSGIRTRGCAPYSVGETMNKALIALASALLIESGLSAQTRAAANDLLAAALEAQADDAAYANSF